MERRWRLGMLAAVATGFLLRLAWILVAVRPHVGMHDPAIYQWLATSVAEGLGYSGFLGTTAYYPPGYPLALSAVIWLVRHSPLPDDVFMAAAVANLVLGTATVAMVGVTAQRLVGPRTGAAAAAAAALFPSLILYTSVMLTETLFNTLLVAAMLILWWHPWRDPGGGPSLPPLPRIAVVGLVLGAAMLVRPTLAPAVLLLIVAFFLARRSLAQWIATCAVLGVAMVLVISPWTIRNYVQLGAFVPISTNTGDNLCIGNHPGATGAFSMPDYCFGGLPGGDPIQAELARNQLMTSRALAWMREHPTAQPSLVLLRTYYMLQHDHEALRAATSYESDMWLSPFWFDVLRVVSDWYYYAALVLALVGLARFVTWQDQRRIAMAMVVAGILLAPAAFFGEPRFHVPLLPFVAILAAVALSGEGAPGKTSSRASVYSPPFEQPFRARQGE